MFLLLGCPFASGETVYDSGFGRESILTAAGSIWVSGSDSFSRWYAHQWSLESAGGSPGSYAGRAVNNGDWRNLVQVIHDDGVSQGLHTLSFEYRGRDDSADLLKVYVRGYDSLDEINLKTDLPPDEGESLFVDPDATWRAVVKENAESWTPKSYALDFDGGYQYVVICFQANYYPTTSVAAAIDNVSITPEPASLALLLPAAALLRRRRS
jgi:hypothetical protein